MEIEAESRSKKVGGGGSGGDHKLESGSSNATIDLLPPEMLLSIFKFVPFSDLLACRAVNKNWRSAASDPVKKRGNAIPLGEEDIPKDKREKTLKNLISSVNATVEAGGDFPVDKFQLTFEDCDESKVRQLLHDVSSFASELTFHFCPEKFLIIRDAFLSDGDNLPTNFPKLKFLGVEIRRYVASVSQRKEIVEVDFKICNFIRGIIQRAPKLEDVSLGIFGISNNANGISNFFDGFGLRDKTNFLNTLKIEASFRLLPIDWNALSGLGLKLKHLTVSHLQNGLSLFLASKAGTLLTLVLDISGSRRKTSMDFPCLSVLQKLKIENKYSHRDWNPIKFPTVCYETQLPALKELCLLDSGVAWKDFIKGNEMTPSITVVKLNLPWGMPNDTAVLRAAILFPNLGKLGLPIKHRVSAKAVYEHMSWIEELTLFERKSDADGYSLLDQVITGLPEMDRLECSRGKAPLSRWWYSMIANLESPTHAKKSMAALTNLKLLKIEPDVTDDNWAGLQFNEISGYVVKRMESLECIDFGIRRFPPLIPSVLKNDLQKHVALVYRPPLHRRSAIDMLNRDNYFQKSSPDDSDASTIQDGGMSD